MQKDYRQVAQSWLGEGYDEQTHADVKAMLAGDPAVLEDAFYRNLEFGTAGLRGVMGTGTNRMNKYVVGMATQGLANYMKENVSGDDLKVCISFDCRNHSEEFAQITAKILSNNGIKVYIFESMRPTPELSYAVRLKKATAGVMITASHNPKEYNGYKVFWSDGGQIVSPVDKDIVDYVNRIEDPSQVKFVSNGACAPIEKMGKEVDELYLRDLNSLMLSPDARAKFGDKIKFVYTPLHGTGMKLVPECLARLGFTKVCHVPEQDVADGNFPTVMSPNPEEPTALKMAIDVAEREGADIVLATDPDADRMGIAVRNDKGEMTLLSGNQTMCILTYYILTRWQELGKLDSNKYVIRTIVSTELMTRIAESFGVKIYNVLTGFKNIAYVMKQNEGKSEFVCGGEESYGFNVGEFVRDKDAQIACMMVAECAAWAKSRGMSIWDVLQEMYAKYGYHKEAQVSLVRKGKSGVEEIAAIMTEFRQNPPKDLAGKKVVKVIDYTYPEKTGLPSSNVLQFFSEDGDVVSVRPSGTEPKIKFYFCAHGSDANSKIDAYKAQFAR